MIANLPPQFEVGKSSWALLRDDLENDLIPCLMSQTDQLVDRFVSLASFIRDPGSNSLRHQVEMLKEGKKEDTDAI